MRLWVAKDPSFLHADSEDSDQTGDAQSDLSLCGRTLILLGLSCRGSFFTFTSVYLFSFSVVCLIFFPDFTYFRNNNHR